MRNLKRALSLALASVMLLGMMVVGTNAASTNFADDADIVNTEAAAITAGLGIFAGADGKFLPNETVTRAQMAAITVKMLYGSNFNADPFKGINTFTDVADYQGGWAEGYINLCASLGIVKGYGDNTFKPGATVTTAEAVTFILNALNVDAGAGTWPATVMAKATEIKLFGDKVPSTNVGLSRDDLSVLVLNGIKYSPATGATGDWAYDSTRGEWVQRPGTATDSLANKVFGLQSKLGVVTDNQATGAKTTKVNVATTNADGKITAIAGTATEFNVETGLDMIGRVVTVYYKTTGEKGTVYAVVDESKVVKVATAIADSATKMATAFGKGTDDAAAVVNFANYAGTVGSGISGFTKDTAASKGTYALYAGEVVTFVAPAANIGVLAKVTAYTAPTAKATGSITITGLTAEGAIGTTAAIRLEKVGSTTADVVKLYDGIKSGAYVYVTKVGANAAVVEKAEIVTATIDARANDNSKVTIAGESLSVASVGSAGMVTANNTAIGTLGLTSVASATLGTTVYNIVKTSDGKVLGYYSYTPASAAKDYAVVQGVAVTAASGADTWSSTTFKPATAQVKLALADGTSAVYSIKLSAAGAKKETVAEVKAAAGITYGEGETAGEIVAGDIVKIAVTDGVITEIKEQATTNGTAVKKGSTLVTGISGKYLTADSVVIYWDSADTTNWKITKFVGYNTLKTVAGAIDEVTSVQEQIVKAVVNTNNEVVFAYVDAAGTTSSSATTKAIIKSTAYTVRYDAAAKANRYDYTAIVDGEQVTLTAKEVITPSGTAAAPYVATYTMTDGFLTAIAYIASGSAKDNYVSGAISYMTGDILVVGSTEYTYANAKAYIVSSDYKTVTATEVMKAAAESYDTYMVIGAAATSSKVADVAYIYYIAK